MSAPTSGTHMEKSHHLLPRANQAYQYTCEQLQAYYAQLGINYSQYYPQCAGGYNAAPATPAMGNNGLPQVPKLPASPPSLPLPNTEELIALPELPTLPALTFAD